MIGRRLRAILELARLSNAPTVVSNTLTGVGLGALAADVADPVVSPFAHGSRVAAASLACVALYASGMVLNDYVDRNIDARERPSRPIPSGRISPERALVGAILLAVVGLALLASISAAAAAAGCILAILILLYDLVHVRARGSVLLMGACRGMVYVVGALTVAQPERWAPVLLPALLLAGYVVGFSLIARSEADPAARAAHPIATALLAPMLLAAALVLPTSGAPGWPAVAIGGALAGAIVLAGTRVLVAPPRIGAAVTLWIASIALYDAYVLALLGWWWASSIAVACFVATRAAQRRIAGT